MPNTSKNTALRLISLLGSLSGPMCLAILFGATGSLCAIGVPVLGTLALLAIAGITQAPFVPLLVALALCAVLRGALHYAEHYFNHFIAFKLLAVIRQKIFTALCRLAPAKLEGRDKGDLISLVTADVELIEVFYAHTISPIFIAVLVSGVMCICLAFINPLLAGVAAVAYLVVGAVIPLLASRTTAQAGRVFRNRAGALNSYILDSLRGIKQSIQYDDGEARLEQMQSLTYDMADCQSRMKVLEGRAAAITSGIVVLFSAAMMTAGVLLFDSGAITASGAVIATVAMLSSFGPVIALAGLPGNLTHTFAAANRIFELMDEQPVVEPVSGGASVPFMGMSLKNVNFSYSAGASSKETDSASAGILADFNMQIPLHRIVGVTGKSGSGKSTALKLLMRFWDTTEGEVLFSGRDIKDINTCDLRQSQC